MRTPVAILLVLASIGLRADGATDLKGALARMAGHTPVKGTLDLKRTTRNGEGKDLVERIGQASAWVEDGPQGLRVSWDRGLLGRVQQEARALRRDPDARTPATLGLGALSARVVAEQVHAAEGLASQLEHATVVSEVPEPWKGRPARKLTFELSLKSVNGRDRKYVKEFAGTTQVWIEEDGTPLAAVTRTRLKGRAFLVVTFSQEQEESAAFQRVGDRLVCLRLESSSSGSGAGEKGGTHSLTTFTVQ